MIELMRAMWWILGSWLKSRERLEAENLSMRHQVTVLRRPAPRRLRLRGSDRFLFVWLYRLKSRATPGRPRVAKEIRDLTREVSLSNLLWGARRIHGELLKVGIDVAQSTVAKRTGATDRIDPARMFGASEHFFRRGTTVPRAPGLCQLLQRTAGALVSSLKTLHSLERSNDMAGPKPSPTSVIRTGV